jgi:hypothetical protein
VSDQLQPHQQRVIEEKAALDEKLSRLIPFLRTDTCYVLPLKERCQLKRQADAMTEYAKILGERIAGFGVAE